MATAMLKIQYLKTPIAGHDRELMRYVAAHPNNDGPRNRPIFTGKYFIAESSDIPLEEFSPQYFSSFKERLLFLGFDNLEIVE